MQSSIAEALDPFASLSVVVPSYNGRAFLEGALAALIRCAPSCEVVVVDGGSTDGSAAMVKERFPQYGLIECKNHGFAHAANRGIEATSREYVLLLNSDVYLTREPLIAMMSRLEDARVGAVAPVLLNLDGSRQRVFGNTYWPNWLTVRKPSTVPVLSMACFMTRRDRLVELGGMDENLFLYNEEHDWCARARAAGYTLEIVPETVLHVGGASTKHSSAALLLETRRGYLYITDKHGWASLPFWRFIIAFDGLWRAVLDPRADWRPMWARLSRIAIERDYLASPFPLSGRGTPRFGAEQAR
jgi:N-acetylglucosaminyl-diphospho-decaprenol L-rhamnosyltransferase